MERDSLRWVSGALVRISHDIGLSGAMQNLLLDIFTPIFLCAAIGIITLSFSRMSVAGSLRVAWFGAFGTVLFNQANPLLLGAFPNLRTADTLWTVAWEAYLPIIRSPEPQLSLLICAFALIVFFRFKRLWWILLLPGPFLYFPVAILYGYPVGTYLCWLILGHMNKLPQNYLYKIIFANLVTFLLLCIFIFILGAMGALDSGISLNLTSFTHQPRISPLLIWTVLSLTLASFFWHHSTSIKNNSAWIGSCLTAIFLQLFISNQQIISGVEIHSIGLQSVVGTAVAAFSLCLLIESLIKISNLRMQRIGVIFFCSGISVWILISINVSQGLDLVNKKYPIFINHDITQHEFNLIRSNPFKTIVLGTSLSPNITLATPRQIAPAFAYQYNYPWFTKVCKDAIPLTFESWSFVEQHHNDPFLKDDIPYFRKFMERFANLYTSHQPESRKACVVNAREGDFFAIIPVTSDVFYKLW